MTYIMLSFCLFLNVSITIDFFFNLLRWQRCLQGTRLKPLRLPPALLKSLTWTPCRLCMNLSSPTGSIASGQTPKTPGCRSAGKILRSSRKLITPVSSLWGPAEDQPLRGLQLRGWAERFDNRNRVENVENVFQRCEVCRVLVRAIFNLFGAYSVF